MDISKTREGLPAVRLSARVLYGWLLRFYAMGFCVSCSQAVFLLIAHGHRRSSFGYVSRLAPERLHIRFGVRVFASRSRNLFVLLSRHSPHWALLA